MKNRIIPLAITACMFQAQMSHADAPLVVTDIAPVHALVSQVMAGVGTPDLVVPQASSPHHHAMRPSEARMLSQADLVVWVGHGLAPWLEGPIENLAKDAKVMELMTLEDVHLLPFREGALFEVDGHDHDHGHGHGHGDAEEGEAYDPHIWLDPDNARLFLAQIAAELAVLDPDNAQTYAENARLGGDAIRTIDRQIAGQLEPLRGAPFIVLHDGFHYFEAHYEIEAIGAISPSDAQTPGAGRIKELRAALPDSRLRCAFAEPETGGRLIETVTEGLEVRTAVLDPLGTDLTLGPTLYTELLAKMGQAMQECLAP